MTREEAVNRFKGIRESFSISIAQSKFYPSKDILDELCDMAIKALSAEQKEEDLANDIARQMATIIENEQDMRVILKNASAEDEQGVGRYENAMQKLRDMPRYLNGVKEKQITKISTNYTTEKPNDVVEQKNDVVAEPTDLISRAEVLDIITFKRKLANIDGRILLDEIEDRINALPSADITETETCQKCQETTERILNNQGERIKALEASAVAEPSGDLISRADAEAFVCMERCGEYRKDCPAQTCPIIEHLDSIPSADRPSGEWIPCSERMPMMGDYVLTYRPTMGMRMIVDAYEGYYGEDDDEWREGWIYGGDKVTAWMPLPKPYCPNCGAKMGSD